jgi:molybdate transport system substrate-binding protein
MIISLSARAADLHVYAASSLTDALKEIGTAYEKETGDRVIFNFAASSVLARQIEESAPGDLFFSADEAKMDELQKRGLINESTRHDLLSNTLVIVIASDSQAPLSAPADLKKSEFQRIAIADPKSVPAGVYAREFLSQIGLVDALQSKLVPTENVRAALAAVEAGNADAGFVYKTDATLSKKVKIACTISGEHSPKIIYPAAILKSAPDPTAAEKFLRFVQAETARGIFEKFGFIVRK